MPHAEIVSICDKAALLSTNPNHLIVFQQFTYHKRGRLFTDGAKVGSVTDQSSGSKVRGFNRYISFVLNSKVQGGGWWQQDGLL